MTVNNNKDVRALEHGRIPRLVGTSLQQDRRRPALLRGELCFVHFHKNTESGPTLHTSLKHHNANAENIKLTECVPPGRALATKQRSMVTPNSISDESHHEEAGTSSSLTDLCESNWLRFSPNFKTILKIYVPLPVIIMRLKGKDFVSGQKVKFVNCGTGTLRSPSLSSLYGSHRRPAAEDIASVHCSKTGQGSIESRQAGVY